MRFLVRLVVLGFAAFGVYRAWELAAPMLTDARTRAVGARDKIEPAIRDAATTLQAAGRDAADVVTQAPNEPEGPAPDAFGAAAQTVAPTA